MTSKPVTLVTTLLATSALGLGGYELAAKQAADAALSRVMAAHAGLSVGGIDVSPLRGRIVMQDVALGNGAVQVTIGALSLPTQRPSLGLITPAQASPFDDKPEEAPAPATPSTPSPVPSAASMGNASASNVVITTGTTSYHIKRIDLTGTVLTDADVAGLLDAKTAEALAKHLKTLSAAAIVIPEIISDDTTAGSERHWTVKQLLLANVVAGKVANGSAGGMTFTLKDGNGAVDGALGSISTAGLDLAQIAHVFGTRRTDDAEPILPLFDLVTVDTIKINNKTRNASIALASLKETGAKGRALKTDLPASGTTAAQAPGPNGKADRQSAAFFDDLIHSFSVDAIEAADFSAENSEPVGKSVFGASKLAMHGFANGRIADLGMNDFHYADPTAKISLGGTTFTKLTIPAAVPDGTKAPPFSGAVALDHVSVETTGDAPKPNGAVPATPAAPSTPIQFKIGHVDLASDAVDAGTIPPKSTMALRHLTFDLPPGTDATRALYDMGYRHLDLSADVAAQYDNTNQTLDIGKFSIEGADMGTVGLAMTLVNVSNGLVSPNPEIAKASAFAMLIKRLDIDVANKGLFEKAIAWKAKADATTVETERATGVDFFANALPASLGGGANIRAVGGAIAAFINDPKTLHIAASSKNGVGAADMALLATPDVLLNTLDIQASANK